MTDVMIGPAIPSNAATGKESTLCSQDPVTEDMPETPPLQNGHMDEGHQPQERSNTPSGESETETAVATTTIIADAATAPSLNVATENGVSERDVESIAKQGSNGMKRSLEDCLSDDGDTLTEGEEGIMKRRRTFNDSGAASPIPLTNGESLPVVLEDKTDKDPKDTNSVEVLANPVSLSEPPKDKGLETTETQSPLEGGGTIETTALEEAHTRAAVSTEKAIEREEENTVETSVADGDEDSNLALKLMVDDEILDEAEEEALLAGDSEDSEKDKETSEQLSVPLTSDAEEILLEEGVNQSPVEESEKAVENGDDVSMEFLDDSQGQLVLQISSGSENLEDDPERDIPEVTEEKDEEENGVHEKSEEDKTVNDYDEKGTESATCLKESEEAKEESKETEKICPSDLSPITNELDKTTETPATDEKLHDSEEPIEVDEPVFVIEGKESASDDVAVIEAKVNSEPTERETQNESEAKDFPPDCVNSLSNDKTTEENEVEMMDLGEEKINEENEKKSPSDLPPLAPISSTSPSIKNPLQIDTKETPSDTLKALNKLKNSLTDLTRKDLEALIMEKMLEAILFKSKAAENAQKVKAQQQQLNKLWDKLDECKRQFKAMEHLFKNATDEVRLHESKGCKIQMKPVLRTVGIQSQSVHYLKCKACGSKSTTIPNFLPPDNSSDKVSTSAPFDNATQFKNKSPVKDATPKPSPPKPPGPVQGEKKIPPKHMVTITPVPKAKPMKPSPSQPEKLAQAAPQYGIIPNGVHTSAPVTTPPPAKGRQMFVDLTEDDDVPVDSPPKPAQTMPVHVLVTKPNPQKPTNKFVPVAQRQSTGTAAMPPLVVVARPTQPPPLRVSQPAPIPSQTVAKRVPLEISQLRRMPVAHPAPLPTFLLQVAPSTPINGKLPPLSPKVTVRRSPAGIILTWTMDTQLPAHLQKYAEVKDYQLYGYKKTELAPSSSNWASLGHVKALKLPMAVTLTQFQQGQRYYFCVRARDSFGRYGPFSVPASW